MSRTVRIRRYTVAVNSGFAPCRHVHSNAEYALTNELTLANCMADMRRVVEVGEWVAGMTPNRMTNRLAYLMKVGGEYTREEYWEKYHGSRLDCIYRPNPKARFGFELLPNPWHGADEQSKDMKCHRILWSTEFYWFAQSYNQRTRTPQGLRILSKYRELSFSQRTRFGVFCEVPESFLHWVSEQTQLDCFRVLDGYKGKETRPDCPSEAECVPESCNKHRNRARAACAAKY